MVGFNSGKYSNNKKKSIQIMVWLFLSIPYLTRSRPTAWRRRGFSCLGKKTDSYVTVSIKYSMIYKYFETGKLEALAQKWITGFKKSTMLIMVKNI